MNQTTRLAVFAVSATMAPFALTACMNEDQAHWPEERQSVQTALSGAPGGHLHGISDEAFARARAVFARPNTADEGIGPIFNETACSTCHFAGAMGGAGDVNELRFGRFRSDGTFDSLAALGGSLLQRQSLGTWTNRNGVSCTVALESKPAEATVETGRLPTPLFGLGLVDAMPDSFFEHLASAQPAAVRGTVVETDIKLPDPKDPLQQAGGRRVGRFSWKGVVPSLLEFSAGAYLNEMGITSQHCVRGQSIASFATELAPNGVAVTPIECEDNLPGTDGVVGSCSGGRTEIQRDVAAYATFMTFLAPPPRAQSDDDLEASDSAVATDVAFKGRRLFEGTGCASCHTREAFTTPAHPFNGVPGNYRFRPFSDFLVHDMGQLGDRVGNNGETLETTRKMRTAPLWGIRFRARLLHDGRATTIPAAIAAHDGQAAAAAAAFKALTPPDQQQLVQFVSSL
jgi:CxxC motif-containing protein (DUF1111 family)